MAVDFNNSADTKDANKGENTPPILQVNNPIRPLHSVGSGTLVRSTTSFKSFKNIPQSHRRSHTNSHESTSDGIPGTSSDINLTIKSKSNELIDEFNKKTIEITKKMQGLHFSTIDLRNKLSKGHIHNNHPIIIQVMVGNSSVTSNQVRVEVYPAAQSCWREIRGFLHKEMNLQIKSLYYETLNKNEIFPPWTIVFQPPPNLMSIQCQIETIVSQED